MQKWDAKAYATNARFVADYGESLLELLAIKPGEEILDLGCGDGALTLKLLEAGAKVIGVDASKEMVEAAQKLGLDARQIDGGKLNFQSQFDAVFTNAALHWMRGIDAVLNGVATALKPGGRFIGEMGGFGNCAAIATALISTLNHHGINGASRFPWYFPTANEFSVKLKNHNFKIHYIEIIPRQTPLKTGMHNWLKLFANPFVEGLDDAVKTKIFDEVTAILKPSLHDSQNNWIADYVRLRFHATIELPTRHPGMTY